MEQPGQELAEVEAKLLRIEQLQIELEVRILRVWPNYYKHGHSTWMHI